MQYISHDSMFNKNKGRDQVHIQGISDKKCIVKNHNLLKNITVQ